MKKSEKENLKKAFNIPEPERKEYFVSLYNKKLKKNEPKFNVFFRYASTAVFAVLIIGLWGNIKNAGDVRENFSSIDEPTAVQTTAVIQTAEKGESATSKTTAVQTAPAESGTAQMTAENPPETHPQITTPDIPEFVPSVTEITFPSKPETSANTKTATTAETVQATAIKYTTTVKYTTAKPSTTKSEPDFEYAPSLTTMRTSAVTMPAPTAPAPSAPEDEPAETTQPSDNLPPAIIPQETNLEPSAPSVDSEGRNYTVTPIAEYTKSAKFITNDGLESDTNGGSVNGAVSMDNMINYSDYIIWGKIDRIIYTHVNGIPYTQEDITVYRAYKGNSLCQNDRISVYIPGGYMPVREFETLNSTVINAPDDYSLYYSGGNRTQQTVGTVYIFFLTNAGGDIPDGAFELTMKTDISIFQARNGEYISIGNNSLKFDIKSLLNP